MSLGVCSVQILTMWKGNSHRSDGDGEVKLVCLEMVLGCAIGMRGRFVGGDGGREARGELKRPNQQPMVWRKLKRLTTWVIGERRCLAGC